MRILSEQQHTFNHADAVSALSNGRYFSVDNTTAHAAVDALCAGTPAYVISGAQGAGKDVVAAAVASTFGADGVEVVQQRTSGLIRAEAGRIVDIIRSGGSRDEMYTAVAGELDLADVHAKFVVDVLHDNVVDDDNYSPWTRDDAMRTALQYMGMEARIDTHPGYWTEACYEQVARTLASGCGVYLADGRFPGEIIHAVTVGMYTARLYVPEHVRVERIMQRDGITPANSTLQHPGETVLDDMWTLFHAVVDNSATSPRETVSYIADHVAEHANSFAVAR